MATPEEIALERSRRNKTPNVDFSKALDLGLLGKLKGMLGYGSTCTNTATGFYYPDRTTAGSMNLLTNPNEAGFKIINQLDAVPGSLIIMSEPNGAHRHTGVFDSVWQGEPYYNLYGDRVEAGDTLINYSNGKREPEHYRIRRPINKVFPERTKHTYLKSMRNGSKLIPKAKYGKILKFLNSGVFPIYVESDFGTPLELLKLKLIREELLRSNKELLKILLKNSDLYKRFMSTDGPHGTRIPVYDDRTWYEKLMDNIALWSRQPILKKLQYNKKANL